MNLEEAMAWCRDNQACVDYGPRGNETKPDGRSVYTWAAYRWIAEVDDEKTGVGQTPQAAVEDLVRQEKSQE